MVNNAEQLEHLLNRHRPRLLSFIRKEGKAVLRYETEDDIAQGIHMHTLSVADKFEYRSDDEFLGWLFTVARQELVNRHRHWTAARRNGGRMIRVTLSGSSPSSVGSSGVNPIASITGPSTVASRKEQLAIAARVIKQLNDRDQKLIQWMSEDLPIEDVAENLGVEYEAAKRARLRAIEKFRKHYEKMLSPDS